MSRDNYQAVDILSALSAEVERNKQFQTAEVICLNSRPDSCAHPGCLNKAYAKGLCNAHYLRARANKDMNAPIQKKERSALCKECGEKVGSRGGWGLCSKHYKAHKRKTFRRLLIEMMGNKCSVCNGQFPDVVYDFHHRDSNDKKADPSSLIDAGSLTSLADEISKCELLCANCHRIEHHGC